MDKTLPIGAMRCQQWVNRWWKEIFENYDLPKCLNPWVND